MYKGRHFIRQRVYVCGDYLDVDIYPVFQPAGKRRAKCNPTREVQQKLNERNSDRHALRVVHTNFSPDDYYLTFTYTDEPESTERAAKDAYNYLKRVKRRRAKLGLPELKYCYSVEKGSENGRVHIHIILSGGMSRDELEDLWGKGRANASRLQFAEDGITGLVKYMRKARIFFRAWSQSRNLVMPEPQIVDGAVTVEEVETLADAIDGSGAWDILEEQFPGYALVAAGCEHNAVNRAEYIHAEMWASPQWRYEKRRREAKEAYRCSA